MNALARIQCKQECLLTLAGLTLLACGSGGGEPSDLCTPRFLGTVAVVEGFEDADPGQRLPNISGPSVDQSLDPLKSVNNTQTVAQAVPVALAPGDPLINCAPEGQTNNRVLRFNGPTFPNAESFARWGASMVVLPPGITMLSQQGIDASQFDGIAFWMRADLQNDGLSPRLDGDDLATVKGDHPDEREETGPRIVVRPGLSNIIVAVITGDTQADQCLEAEGVRGRVPFREQCGDHYLRFIAPSSEWQFYRIPFSELRQYGWGAFAPRFDATDVRAIAFGGTPFEPINVLIDDISFYTDEAGSSPSIGMGDAGMSDAGMSDAGMSDAGMSDAGTGGMGAGGAGAGGATP